MLVFGAASNPWEMLSSLQGTNTSAPAAGIGVGPFITDDATSPATAAGNLQSVLPPTGTTGQASLSPDVLGFLIWNQSQQPGSTQAGTSGGLTNSASGTNSAAGAAAGTGDATGATGSTAFAPWQSLFSLLGSAGNGIIASAGVGAGLGVNGSPATGTAAPNQSTTTGNGSTLFGEPDAASESRGAHGHHHHPAGFAIQSQSNSSDQFANPLANLLGSSAQGASSATATNANGSTTTTITYADGSEVTLTTPPQASSTNPGATAAVAQPSINSNNFLEALIQMQARLAAPSSAA
jgi:hypothetical protein